MKASDIVAFLGGYEYGGNLDVDIEGASSLVRPKRHSLIFCKMGYKLKLIGVRDCLVVLGKDDVSALDDSNVYVISDNPRLTFIRLVKRFFANIASASNVSIHPSVSVGVYVTIEGKVWIGRDVCIQSHVSIGSAGFGYERNENGELEEFLQLGRVVIEDDVRIGSHANIQRGALEDTILRKGCKIGPYCNVAHGTEIGEHTFIAGGGNLGGSSRVGDFSWVGMGTTISSGVRVGSDVMLGAGSVVVKDIEDGYLAYGVPAKCVRRWKNDR